MPAHLERVMRRVVVEVVLQILLILPLSPTPCLHRSHPHLEFGHKRHLHSMVFSLWTILLPASGGQDVRLAVQLAHLWQIQESRGQRLEPVLGAALE